MSNQNPRPELMSSLKSICKHLDKKTLELEQEISVPYTRSVKGPYASNFADSLLEDTKKMGGQIDQTSQIIKGEADNLESFLETTMAQFQDHLEEVGQIERYMAQYGYNPLPPLPPEVVDWKTPPAAADLSPEPKDQTKHEKILEASNIGTGTPPSIFELGLSKRTLETVVGKSVKIKPLEEVKHAIKPVIEENNENNDASQDVTIDMTVNASPILRLTSRLKDCNASLDASSSYTTADTDTSQVEITPGLMVRRPGSSLRNRPSQATTPNEPILSSVSLVKSAQRQTTTPNQPSLASQEDQSTTPSEPNLTTQVKVPFIAPSTPTTTAKIEFSPDGTPVMPTLKTVNLNAFNLSKPVSDEKKEETATSQVKGLAFQTTEKVDFGPKSTGPSFAPKTPLQKFKKEVIAGTPQTPELVTMDIRKLISNAMGLNQNQGEGVVGKTTPSEPELTVPRSIPDSKGDTLGSRATPEEPELKRLVSTSRIVHNVGGGLDNTPELPELSIMADRTTMREDTFTPDTPIFSNLGRFQKYI